MKKKQNSIKSIIEETKGKTIYIELANGFYAKISKNELKTSIEAMYKENEDLNKIETSINGEIIHITFRKEY